MSAYEEALRSLAASEGIEYVDCRVQPGWEERPRLRVVEPLPADVRVREDAPMPEPILLRSTYEQLVLDPHYREAADRGREIHERASAHAEKKGIPYEQALKEIT